MRTSSKIRTRQPLSHAVVHAAGDHDALVPLLDLVASELNVKDVVFAESEQELGTWRARPNFRALGPRLGDRVKSLASALAADDGSLAGRLARGEQVTVQVDGNAVELAPEGTVVPERRLAADVAVRDVRATDDSVSGVVVNRSRNPVRDVRLVVNH